MVQCSQLILTQNFNTTGSLYLCILGLINLYCMYFARIGLLHARILQVYWLFMFTQSFFFFLWKGHIYSRHTYMYTLSIKRNLSVTSSEQHSLKSQALKWIIIGHRLAIVLLTKHTSKKKRLIESKKIKLRWNSNLEVIFQKSQKLLPSRAR